MYLGPEIKKNILLKLIVKNYPIVFRAAQKQLSIVISVWLWNFKGGGS